MIFFFNFLFYFMKIFSCSDNAGHTHSLAIMIISMKVLSLPKLYWNNFHSAIIFIAKEQSGVKKKKTNKCNQIDPWFVQ